MIVFKTPRLVIREYEPEDAAFVLDMYSREDVQRYLGQLPLHTLDEASQRIGRWRKGYAGDPRQGAWAVTLRGTGELLGTVAVKRAWLSRAAPLPQDEGAWRSFQPTISDDWEVGWHLHPHYWGHGYATEAAAGALQRAFAAGIAELIALVDPANEPSRKVAERLGMRYVGLTDRYNSMEQAVFRIVLSERLT